MIHDDFFVADGFVRVGCGRGFDSVAGDRGHRAEACRGPSMRANLRFRI